MTLAILFLRIRRPPLFELPKTHSRPSRIHRWQGGFPGLPLLSLGVCSLLTGFHDAVGIKKKKKKWSSTYRSHLDLRCRQCRHALETRCVGPVLCLGFAATDEVCFSWPMVIGDEIDHVIRGSDQSVMIRAEAASLRCCDVAGVCGDETIASVAETWRTGLTRATSGPHTVTVSNAIKSGW